VIGTARAPSEFRIDFESTTNWKSLLDTDLSGALDFDTTINLSFLSSKEFGADCKLDFDNKKLAFGLMKVTISHRLKFSTMRSRPNLDAVSFDTFVLIQQSTERWMVFCLSQLTLASPLWRSMLLLLIEGDPNRKRRDHNFVACTTIQKALYDLFDEVTGLLP
jgi:hypothetical protein